MTNKIKNKMLKSHAKLTCRQTATNKTKDLERNPLYLYVHSKIPCEKKEFGKNNKDKKRNNKRCMKL